MKDLNDRAGDRMGDRIGDKVSGHANSRPGQPAGRSVSNPFAAIGDRSLDQRFASLKLRTALVCVAMLLCAAGGWQLLHEPLEGLIAQAWQLSLGQAGLPRPDVPEPEDPGLRALLQQAALLGVSALALIGHSMGAFGKLKMRWALVPPLAIALVFAWVAPAGRGFVPLLPGPLERAILHGRSSDAAKILEAGGYATVLRQYVQSQVALRSGDVAALRREGEPVLLQADKVAYGVDWQVSLQFQPDVLLAIDKGVNGQPETEIGMRRQRENDGAGLRNGAAFTVRVLLGAAALAAAAVLLKLWNLMRRRVGTIGQQMQADADEAAALALREAALFARPARPKSPPPPPVSWRVIGRLVVLVTAPVMFVKGMSAWLGPSESREVSRAPQALVAKAGDRPCNLVGAWTSSRGDSVFKVTMTEDGRFTAEPIAAGPYGKQSYRGSWEVFEGKQIRWIDDYRSEDKSDVNDILDLQGRSFTLREVNGSKTRFNRIGPAPGQKRCTG